MKVTRFTTILSGQTVSADVQIGNSEIVGLHFPAITSCSMTLQAGFTNATSAQYFNISNTNSGGIFGPAGGAISLLTGVGSVAMVASDLLKPFPAFRLVAGVAQTDTRTIGVSLSL
jgi:hypothetical protein